MPVDRTALDLRDAVFLRRLILQNVRSIADVDLDFTSPDTLRQWTLLLGENGSGKSTVLRALALVLSGSEALSDLIGSPSDWVQFGANECKIQAELESTVGGGITTQLIFRREATLRETLKLNDQSLEQIDALLSADDRHYLTVGYGVTRRLNPGSVAFGRSGPYKSSRAQRVATLFSPEAVLNPLEQWAMDLHYTRGDEGLAIVKNAVTDLLPGVEFTDIDRRSKRLMFRTADGQVPLSLLSDGYQSVAAWVGDLLYRITESSGEHGNPFDATGLLLVDEIDLHLHVTWQRQLMDFLTSKLPNFQIVGTTHSPLMAHQARAGELYFLRRSVPNARPILHRYSGEPRKMMLHQLLMSPLFGVATLDSKEVEELKKEYRELRIVPKQELSTNQKVKLAELEGTLVDLPEWSIESPYDRKQRETLESIETILAHAALGGEEPDDS